MYRELMTATGEAKRAERKAEMASLDALNNEVSRASAPAYGLALLPPPSNDIEEWMTPRDLVDLAIERQVVFEDAVPLLNRFESLVAARGNAPAFAGELKALQGDLEAAATARGEYDKIPLEISYYRWDFFYKALLLYGLAFLVVVALWMRPRSKILPKVLWVTALVPTGLVVAGIVVRCVLRDRPPVSTLYETILFITAVGALTLFFVEWVNRKRVALPMSVILGAIGMFLAMKFEQSDGEDTMPALVAVLDTNFWLATHVTTVTAGYSAGLLAALFGHVYLFGKWFGVKRGDPQFYRNVARMTYGALCFGVVFSVIGTILGGIWANYSWGRFWGWDPKENGALMIVLWELAVLHARMGGYIRDFGLCMAAVFGAMVIAFSWWGVNVLGVGLHSYGFTSGIATALNGFYWFEGVVLAVGAGYWLLSHRRARVAG